MELKEQVMQIRRQLPKAEIADVDQKLKEYLADVSRSWELGAERDKLKEYILGGSELKEYFADMEEKLKTHCRDTEAHLQTELGKAKADMKAWHCELAQGAMESLSVLHKDMVELQHVVADIPSCSP